VLFPLFSVILGDPKCTGVCSHIQKPRFQSRFRYGARCCGFFISLRGQRQIRTDQFPGIASVKAFEDVISRMIDGVMMVWRDDIGSYKIV
jgi:hypothetical protein